MPTANEVMADVELYCVWGWGMKHESPFAGGCHFASFNKAECVQWLAENWPEVRMLNDSQFSFTARWIESEHNFGGGFWWEYGAVCGEILPVVPSDEYYQEAILFLFNRL